MFQVCISYSSPPNRWHDGVTKTKLGKLAVYGGGMGINFPKVNFNCLNGQNTVTLKGIDIFERANEHSQIGVSVLQYKKILGG